MKPITVILASLRLGKVKFSVQLQITTYNEHLPDVFKCRGILEVEWYNGNVPLKRIVCVIQLVGRSEHGIVPLLHDNSLNIWTS